MQIKDSEIVFDKLANIKPITLHGNEDQIIAIQKRAREEAIKICKAFKYQRKCCKE